MINQEEAPAQFFQPVQSWLAIFWPLMQTLTGRQISCRYHADIMQGIPCPYHLPLPRHAHMLRCQDCLAFAESLTGALPYLDPGIFKTRQSVMVISNIPSSALLIFTNISSPLSLKCREDGSKIWLGALLQHQYWS